MKEVEQLVYQRLVGDTEVGTGLVDLLGGTTSAILHAFQNSIPEVPYLTYQTFSEVKGQLGGSHTRSYEIFIQFNVFARNYGEIISRLRQLFDGYRFDIPSDYTEVGQLRGVFDLNGPDGYDETLEVEFKQVRYRFFVTPKAWNPITA